MPASPQRIVAQPRDRRRGEGLIIRGHLPGDAVDDALGDRAAIGDHGRDAHRLRLGQSQAEGFTGIAAIEHEPCAGERCGQRLMRDRREAAHADIRQTIGAAQDPLHPPRPHRVGGGAVGRRTGVEVQLRPRHRRPDPGHPEIEQPVKPAQRIGGEDRARFGRFARQRPAKVVEHAVRYDSAPAGQQPRRNRRRMVGPGHHQDRPVPDQAPQIARLLQIAARVVQPKRPLCGAAHQTDHPMAAIGDVEIASGGNPVAQRGPADAVPVERRMAAAARVHPVAASRQRLGQRHKGGFGAAERRRRSHGPVEGDPVIGHHDMRHQRHTVRRPPPATGAAGSDRPSPAAAASASGGVSASGSRRALR